MLKIEDCVRTDAKQPMCDHMDHMNKTIIRLQRGLVLAGVYFFISWTVALLAAWGDCGHDFVLQIVFAVSCFASESKAMTWTKIDIPTFAHAHPKGSLLGFRMSISYASIFLLFCVEMFIRFRRMLPIMALKTRGIKESASHP